MRRAVKSAGMEKDDAMYVFFFFLYSRSGYVYVFQNENMLNEIDFYTLTGIEYWDLRNAERIKEQKKMYKNDESKGKDIQERWGRMNRKYNSSHFLWTA